MGKKLYSLEESAEFAGVSPETIVQYGEFGLLQPVEGDGGKQYRLNELRTLFGSSSDAELSESETEVSDVPQDLEDNIQASYTRNSQRDRSASTQPLVDQIEVDHDSPVIDLKDEVSSNHKEEWAFSGTYYIETTEALREQVKMLREERDWLRNRLEKLEARSEREQLLLMSESETIRNLIGKPKRWSFSLPWFK